MAQLPKLQPVHITRADILYVPVSNNTWKRLPSSIDNYKHSCYGVGCDDGVIRTLSDHFVRSICCLKLKLKSPVIGIVSTEAMC